MPEAGGTPRNKKKNKGSAKALDEDDANHDASFKKQAEQSPNSHFIEEEATREKHDTMTDENKGHTKDTPITHPNDDRQIYTEDGGNAVHRMPGSPQDALQAKERFDALVRDRDSLRAEVIDMRKTLEGIQLKHRADMEALQQKVDDTESKKEHAESQFQKLLERVNTIKSQLGERLKEDAVGGAYPSEGKNRRAGRTKFDIGRRPTD
ncbi:hypothetical protein BDV25DRAFT_40355 [Aspergillus avenaceus]|uniref:Uncharacterized protein n=1 Tax=Aspergillus avenaceus TaxID=36643 RepID=A0A5N6TL68_ASPAV|nr:hypothetical protein BDV25DRAFT_40355 [Aspergillus avenaceus]